MNYAMPPRNDPNFDPENQNQAEPTQPSDSAPQDQPGQPHPMPGQPANSPMPGEYVYQQPTNVMGIVSLILGILSVISAPMSFCCFLTFGATLLFGLIGSFLGYMGMKEAKSGQVGQGGLAQAGMWTSIAGLTIGLLLLVFYVFIIGMSAMAGPR